MEKNWYVGLLKLQSIEAEFIVKLKEFNGEI